jgi:predicted nucleotidyltransferase
VAIEAVRELDHRGVRACIVGGLAVVEHGYARATADVDLMVVESHRVTGTPLGIPGVSMEGWDVPVDVLYIDPKASFLRDEVIAASGRTPPVLALEPLIFLKLSAYRMKDRADIVELLKVDMARVEVVRRWLARHVSADLRERFERAVAAATEELAE